MSHVNGVLGCSTRDLQLRGKVGATGELTGGPIKPGQRTQGAAGSKSASPQNASEQFLGCLKKARGLEAARKCCRAVKNPARRKCCVELLTPEGRP